jgi:hypothetical protein
MPSGRSKNRGLFKAAFEKWAWIDRLLGVGESSRIFILLHSVFPFADSIVTIVFELHQLRLKMPIAVLASANFFI